MQGLMPTETTGGHAERGLKAYKAWLRSAEADAHERQYVHSIARKRERKANALLRASEHTSRDKQSRLTLW